MSASVSFDRAADTYDATRALPTEVASRLTEALLAELGRAGTDRLLEVGIGTGRIARPLAERGVGVAGVDIAPRMLARLREQLTPRHAPPDLLLGDATAMPIAGGAFRAALVVHVFHLVEPWERAAEEIARVLATGGVLIHHYTRYPEENPWQDSLRRRAELLEEMGMRLRQRPSDEQLAAKFRALGGTMRREVYATEEERTAPRHWLERARNRVDSWTWEVPEEMYPAFFERYESWCREHYGDLAREHVERVSYELEVWAFDGA